MASHPHDFGTSAALPLNSLLAAIPSLPRLIIARLTARLIELMDSLVGDPELKDCEGQTRVGDQGPYLFDHKQSRLGRRGRRGRTYAGMIEDDEDNHDRELEGTADDLSGLVPLSHDPHPDFDRIRRELSVRAKRC